MDWIVFFYFLILCASFIFSGVRKAGHPSGAFAESRVIGRPYLILPLDKWYEMYVSRVGRGSFPLYHVC